MQNNILSFEDISIGLKHKRLYFVSRESGVSYPVLKRLAEKKDQNFKTDTLRKISKYIIENNKFSTASLSAWVEEVLNDVKK